MASIKWRITLRDTVRLSIAVSSINACKCLHNCSKTLSAKWNVQDYSTGIELKDINGPGKYWQTTVQRLIAKNENETEKHREARKKMKQIWNEKKIAWESYLNEWISWNVFIREYQYERKIETGGNHQSFSTTHTQYSRKLTIWLLKSNILRSHRPLSVPRNIVDFFKGDNHTGPHPKAIYRKILNNL